MAQFRRKIMNPEPDEEEYFNGYLFHQRRQEKNTNTGPTPLYGYNYLATLNNQNQDVPPLEDMSDFIQKVSVIRDMKHSETPVGLCSSGDGIRTTGETTASAVMMPDVCKSSLSSTKSSVQSSESPQTFGGFKKGFLFSSKPSPKTGKNPKNTVPKTTCSGADRVPFIKPNLEAKKQRGEISEVQEAMKSGIPFLDNKDWITGDLMEKIQANPSLLGKLMNPRFSQALAHVQSNRRQAFDMLEGDPEMQQALQDFCGLLGEHFSKLGDQEEDGTKANKNITNEEAIGLVERSTTNPGAVLPSSTSQPSPEDEAKMKDILSKPEVMKALQDSQIQKIIGLLRTNPTDAQRELQNATSEIRAKLKILIDAGLLTIA